MALPAYLCGQVLEVAPCIITCAARDPRQAINSWPHYIQYLRYIGNYFVIIEYGLPIRYFNWLTEDQRHWQILHFFVQENIYRINSWLKQKKNSTY